MRIKQKAFTLIEILVVITIISVLAGVAVLSIGGQAGRVLKKEAQRMQQVLSILSDEAIFQQRNLGLKFHEKQYQVVEFNTEQQLWTPLNEDLLTTYKVDDQIGLEIIESEGLQLKTESNDNDAPELLFLSDGLTSDFKLEFFVIDNRKQRALIISDGIQLPILELRVDG